MKYRRFVDKMRRIPSIFEMLAKIELAQARSRGTAGYLEYRVRALKNHLSDKYPKALQIEPYGGCNLRCAMCFQGRMELPADKHMLDFDTYTRVINQLSPFTPTLYLYWRGEPLLHKSLESMICYAKRHGMYVFVSTNAVNLTENRAKQLINSGLDFLMVGFDGATKDTYEQMRNGADFDALCNSIRTIARLKRERKLSLPHVCLQFIVSALNYDELVQAKRLSKELGADSFIEKALDTYENFDDPRIHSALTPLFTSSVLSKYEERLGKLYYSRSTSCEMAKRMVIRADGEVSLCCYDMQGAYQIGSVHDVNLLELWMGPEYVSLRNKGHRRELPLCTNCGAGVQK